MNGLPLSREYFLGTALPRLEAEFPRLLGDLAAGLVGNGSECFGYDDGLSRDHDWGVDFFLWLPEDKREHLERLQLWKRWLFDECPPAQMRERSAYGAHIGVMTAGDFYTSLIGYPEGPRAISEWRRVPEENLAMAVNGEVFFDRAGRFTATREYLLGYYPEDIRKKKIAAYCMAIAQTGQYNLTRCAMRADWVTVRTVLARFTDGVIGIVFALNRIFRPYYKWAYRRMTELPILADSIAPILMRMAVTDDLRDAALSSLFNDVEEICALIAKELRHEGLTSFRRDPFLVAHGEEVRQSIEDASLRALPAQYE